MSDTGDKSSNMAIPVDSAAFLRGKMAAGAINKRRLQQQCNGQF